MKIRLAKKIYSYFKRQHGSKYWAFRWGYYCGKRSMGKEGGDPRIEKALKLIIKRINTKELDRLNYLFSNRIIPIKFIE